MIKNQHSVSIATSNSYEHLINTDQPFMLILKKGENLFESILRIATNINLKTAMVSGLGALDDVTVAFYHLETKNYDTKLFSGPYELISLNGNISLVDNKPFLHIHAALGKEDFSVVGGHIMDATVGPTAEIAIVPLANPIHRQFNDEIGLKLMCPIIDR